MKRALAGADGPAGGGLAAAAECLPHPSGAAAQVCLAKPLVRPGSPIPLGVRDCCDGFNFALFSRHAERVQLLLFASTGELEPLHVFDLDPAAHKTGDVWHILLDGITWGQAYAFRVYGPWLPTRGHRFDPQFLLLDPYAPAVLGLDRLGGTAVRQEESSKSEETSMADRLASRPLVPSALSLVVDRRFDWQEVRRPKRPWSETVIYETHVRGFTVDPSSDVSEKGTFLGVVEKIPYLIGLGITAVELMPVQQFYESNIARHNPATGETLRDYWGYNTVSYFAPNESYGTRRRPGCQLDEFKVMVRELHRAGIEVIVDIVFNHTAEGGELGPALNFRGLDNAIYYLLDEAGRYRDFTGCGNTFNCGHPVVRDYIVDCLRYWATEMHVDGFRFDLASVLGRNEAGEILADSSFLERIAEDPILRDVKLIAEAWDAGGAFQVGSFSGRRWAEWNCHFRDGVRRFWRGDPGMRAAFASRLCGSADLYGQNGKAPVSSINFLTCHDGFTLNDLVSYAQKHNHANGEGNRDGPRDEYSANYGTEGETSDPAIDQVRVRQIKNMLATLLVSRGVPMLLGGDEFRRTQGGNSNAYCQDNETSWYDWTLRDRNDGLVRFVRELIAIRRRFVALRLDEFYSDRDVRWFDCDGSIPDWHGVGSTLGMLIHCTRPDLEGFGSGGEICLLFNAGAESATFAVPLPSAGKSWERMFDTSKPAQGDVAPAATNNELIDQDRYPLEGRAMAMLAAS